MNRADLQALADVRINEAVALLGHAPPMPDGAYYLAGYAVECALKACIAKKSGQHEWPDKQFINQCHTHDIADLVRLADLELERRADVAVNAVRARNWEIVNYWSERDRYGRHSEAKAKAMIDAVTDTTNGVLPWIKARW